MVNEVLNVPVSELGFIVQPTKTVLRVKVSSEDRRSWRTILRERMDGSMDGWMTCNFKSYSIIVQTYQDNGCDN